MKKKLLLLIAVASISGGLVSCSGGASREEKAKNDAAELAAFQASQPLESGIYNATYFDIRKGEDVKKGHFDGRVLLAVSPKITAIKIYENGNRTKIDYHLAMEKPFEKTDSNAYATIDASGNPVVLIPDSLYMLKFSKGGSDVSISFEPQPRTTGDYLTILEKINEK